VCAKAEFGIFRNQFGDLASTACSLRPTDVVACHRYVPGEKERETIIYLQFICRIKILYKSPRPFLGRKERFTLQDYRPVNGFSKSLSSQHSLQKSTKQRFPRRWGKTADQGD
jgi:hypothetical protein